MTEQPPRSTFTSTWGTVFATAGVAIGLGNIWRFPYMMGKHGGSLFLLAYLVFAVSFGLPALIAEWSLARHTRRGTLGVFRQVGLPGGRLVGYLLVLTVLMASSYYGVIVGWVLYFMGHFGLAVVGFQSSGDFQALVDGFAMQAACLVTVSLICAVALCFGVQRGIEKLSRIGLPVFFLLVSVLLVRVLSLEGAWAGLVGFLRPAWSDFKPTTPLAALGQVFFSLGLGGTFMLCYGTYMRCEEDIPRAAILTVSADVVAALMAGVMILPAALAFHQPISSGPPLMFEVMPTIFQQMPGGLWFGLMFFASVFVVALLSQMAAFEVLVGAATERSGWPRGRCVLVVAAVSSALAIPAIWNAGYIEKSDFIWGSTMQPMGALFAVIAFAWYIDIGMALREMRSGSGLPVPVWLFHWIRIGVPIGITATLVFAWVGN